MPQVGPVQTYNPNRRIIRPVVPIIPPIPVDYLYYERTLIPPEHDLVNTIPFYPPVLPTPPYTPVSVFQFGVGSPTITLPNPVTIGSILIFAVVMEHANSSGGPATLGSPTFGPGAWTRFDPSQIVKWSYALPFAGGGVEFWWKIADSTSNQGDVGVAFAWAAVYELVGGDISNIAIQWQNQPAIANPMIMGSFNGLIPGSLGILVGEWVDNSSNPPNYPTWSGAINGWTFDSLHVVAAVGSNWNEPVSYFAHAYDPPSSLTAGGTRGPLFNGAGQWAGIAIIVPPL